MLIIKSFNEAHCTNRNIIPVFCDMRTYLHRLKNSLTVGGAARIKLSTPSSLSVREITDTRPPGDAVCGRGTAGG